MKKVEIDIKPVQGKVTDPVTANGLILYGIINLLVKQGSIVMINQEDVSNKVRLESLETWNNKQAEELNDCLLNLKS